MQVDDIRRLVKLVEESEIDELEVRRWWTVVRILKRGNGHASGEKTVVVAAPAPIAASVVAPVMAPVAAVAATPPSQGEGRPAAPKAEAKADAGADAGLLPIKSPMVGTFYRAPSPDAAPYVDVGQRVSVGQVVCIVEAMKLMNEIEAEVGGTVERVLIENGHPVEFNQPLFLVRPG
ncbi:MAG: acetyl-CoA carboxylase biotin carboxyl carrier protein [Candidatus Eisenbacteria bacterium]|nr:acetyl-CoA carboxylase biotin carboxyl carrier protein [Candidatus Eisenbacteria bacterium]MCC7143151.1 acetyl-CoA carboxylase biotin carboxyl carrier protein [Candidatus Eisenbacteria bacterium]